MERRDFFGVIAVPLLRRETPPAPMARTPEVPDVIVSEDGTRWYKIPHQIIVAGEK